ncbi:MAG: anti-sigma factor family protein [Caulobacteraceae bacterium]
MTACPDKRLLLNALVDGELDAANAAALEGHVARCGACAAELAEIRGVAGVLAGADLTFAPPAGLEARVLAALEREDRAPRPPPARRRGWEGVVAGAGMTALAASLALFAFMAPAGPNIASEVVESHVRSLQVQHLVDVPTSDRHVVKPWFDGKIDFAPPVVDLAGQGFPLVGGRLDYLGRRPVAALVYRHGPHVINLFVWPGRAPTVPATIHKDGYTLIRWGRGDLNFWAVSDVDPAALARFQKTYVARTAS